MSKVLVWVLAGLGGSLVLRTFAHVVVPSPLAGTLAVAPLVAGLFAATGHLSKETRPRHGLAPAGKLLAAATIFLLAATQGELGFRYADVLGASVIFAGFVGLLAWQAVDSLRRLDQATPSGNPLAFFLIVMAVYAGISPWTSEHRPPDGDEPYYLLLSHSLAFDFDADLANNYAQDDSLAFMPRRIEPQPGDPSGPAGEQFSRHNVLLPLVIAPFYRFAGLAGALAVMSLLAAALATVILRIARLYFPEQTSANLLAASVVAFSPPLLLQSNQVWVEVPAALLVAIAFEAASRLQASATSRARLFEILCAILLLPFLKLRFIALAFPILAIAVARAPRRLRTILLRGLTLLLAVAAAIMLFNQAAFGQALKHHSWRSLLSYLTSPADYLSAPLGLLFDSSFGLFFAAPIWVLALPGAWLTWRRRRALFSDAAIVCAPYLLLLGPRGEWYGGWSPFFRYGMVFLPFLALFLVPIMADRKRLGIAMSIAFLGTATACLAMLWLVLPGWTYNFADGRSYLLDHFTTTFGSDMARLFPSEVRPRAANLIWLLVTLSVSALALSGRRATHRFPFAAGVSALLLAAGGMVLLASALPTRVIEFEDPYVEKGGGELWPSRWVPSRVNYRGSWLLHPGDRLTVPIRPAGGSMALTIDLRRQGRVRADTSLEVLADQARLILLSVPRSRDWSTIRLDPVRLPTDSKSLTFRLTGAGGHVLLDRAFLDWSE